MNREPRLDTMESLYADCAELQSRADAAERQLSELRDYCTGLAATLQSLGQYKESPGWGLVIEQGKSLADFLSTDWK